MMAKGRRRLPRYEREDLAQARDLAKAAKIAEDAAALSRAIGNGRWPGPLFHVWHSKASKERFERNRRLLRGASRSGRGSI